MLLCVCLWVCNLCVKECVFLRSLCQCVCSSNTGFSPYYPHLPPSFLSSLLMVPPSIPNQTLFIYTSIILKPSTFPCMKLLYFTTLHFHLPAHPSIRSSPHSLIPIWFPPSTLLYFPFTSHLCFLALPFLSLPYPFHSVLLPSSLSLSFTQCSVPRSLWLGCSSVAESLCALRCLQSIPSTRAHNQVLPLSS